MRTPHRFELTLSDSSIIGMRRAAQRLMAAALKTLHPDAAEDDVADALRRVLIEMAPAAPLPPPPQPPPPLPPPPPPNSLPESPPKVAPKTAPMGAPTTAPTDMAAQKAAMAAYCEAYQLEATLATALRDACLSRTGDPRIEIATSLAHAAGPTGPSTVIAKLRGGTIASYPDSEIARDRTRSHEIASYPDSVLEGHLIKCDEFDGIHKLKTARPHPAVWNFRQVRSRAISTLQTRTLRTARRAPSVDVFGVPLMASDDPR